MKCNVKCFEKKKSYTRIDMNFCKYELMKKKKKSLRATGPTFHHAFLCQSRFENSTGGSKNFFQDGY